jgi:predicted NACHT family NTPase
MAKIDRLGWAAGFSFISHGVRIGVRVNQPEILDTLLELLPEGWKPSRHRVVEQLYSLKVGGNSARPNLRQFNLLYGNLNKLARTLSLEEVFEAFQKDLQHAVPFLARQKVFVRAGVVGWQGRAIIITGDEGSGKTTVVKELVKRGATYYSDEYAMLDSKGRVHPYVGLTDEFSDKQIGQQPLPVGTILVTRYKEGARFRPRKLTEGQAALELLAHTSATRRIPETALTFAQKAVSQARAFKGVRGEASQLVEWLLGK